MSCKTCEGKGVVTDYIVVDNMKRPNGLKLCPECQPAAAPGRLLKAVKDESLSAAEMARLLTSESEE